MSNTFTELGVPADIAARLAARGVDVPFPIQAATLGDALAGRDVCGRAPTGSGKTIAFGIPLVARVGRAKPHRPRALVLVPTRELAAQVQGELRALAGPNGPRVATFYGGVGFGPQMAALRRGTDIAVACPGRLTDLVARRAVNLGAVEAVVIDEADRMADMGFLPEVRRLLDDVRPDRQTLLFSATLDGDVKVLIDRYQQAPVRHEIEAADDAPENRHIFWATERNERVALTASVIGLASPAIVFCRTRRGADRVAEQLSAAGVRAAAIHGERTQRQRDRALADFTGGRVQALVATDIAARGIHVDDVACVVHFDPAGDEKDYVHRSGRTGRAGAAGLVVSLVPGDTRRVVRTLQRKLGMSAGFHDADLSDLAPDAPLRPALVGSDRDARGGNGGRPRRNRRPSDRPTGGARRADAAGADRRPANGEGRPGAGTPDRPRRPRRPGRQGTGSVRPA